MSWLLTHPALFNIIIMSLYVGASGWWAWHGNYNQMFYWLSALAITLTVTWKALQ